MKHIKVTLAAHGDKSNLLPDQQRRLGMSNGDVLLPHVQLADLEEIVVLMSDVPGEGVAVGLAMILTEEFINRHALMDFEGEIQ